MPKMSGKELVKRVLQFQPNLKIMYMSGYADDFIINQKILDEKIPFIKKPFAASELTGKIREVLDHH